ncbi:type II secretion system protein [Salimicrobium flavidum]|uniref:Prepilin-type N-terminal cleavage/methylation domain-containing protein n=1 Tax=Salimicrobium flavidum TaxID=570947 RepID=A0A1N7JN97_9BACI|nr:type II secretion system protein [Salimicrobium flavidum]SIS50731.1 prepilin-type N-terminal cleavage/methylation domain-containing protein [Salimicrobium flavidum]
MANDKGLTLIEILAAITLFGVIISIFLSLFSDNLLLSNRVENELDAIHVAETAADASLASGEVRQQVRTQGKSCEDNENAEVVPLDSIIGGGVDARFSEGPATYVNYTTAQGETYNLQLITHCRQTYETNLYPVSIEVYRSTDEEPKFLAETYRYVKGENSNEQ